MSAEAKPVLVDTSVWVEMLRHAEHPLRPYVENLIAEDQARLCSAVCAELLQGATTSRDLQAVEDLIESVPILPCSDETWISAGRLSHKLRLKGLIIGLLDCYLAELALAHHSAIFSLDKHFLLISKHTSLELAETV